MWITGSWIMRSTALIRMTHRIPRAPAGIMYMYGGLIPGTANFWRGDPADSRLFAVSYSGGSDSVFAVLALILFIVSLIKNRN